MFGSAKYFKFRRGIDNTIIPVSAAYSYNVMIYQLQKVTPIILLPRCFLSFLTLLKMQHVIRISSNRLARHVLYGQLTHGERLRGAPKKRIIWTPFWGNVTFCLTNWRSWQWTGLRGEMPVRLVFQHTRSTSARPQRTVMHAGMRSPTRLQLVHDAPHATKFVLLTSVFEVISEVTEHSNTASSSDRRTTSRQGTAPTRR